MDLCVDDRVEMTFYWQPWIDARGPISSLRGVSETIWSVSHPVENEEA